MLSSLFARRYLLAKKSHSVINLIAAISVLAVAVPVAAMVILLSVFNGFEGLVKDMYTDFDPDALVSPARGQTFAATGMDDQLREIPGIEAWSYIVEQNAMVDYRGGQSIATIRGVDSLYNKVVPIQKRVVGGEYALRFGQIEQGVVGAGIAAQLGVNTALYDYLHVYAPRRDGISAIIPLEAYRREALLPAGVFALDEQTDARYIIAPIDFARRLFDYPGRATGVALKLAPGASVEPIRAALGDDFKVLTRYEQKASLYRIMRAEKWGIFLIVALVLVIASFCVVGSVVMLVIDKRDDIRTLAALGGTIRFLRAVFTRQGMLIALSGAGLGMLLGVGVCLGQQRWGWVRIPAETMVVDAYPVILQWGDVALVAALVALVGFAIVRLTSLKMIPKSTIRLLGVALTLTLAACSSQREIPEGELSAMLEEVYVANAWLLSEGAPRDSTDLYTPIFAKYGYTPADLRYTLESYSHRKSSSMTAVLEGALARIDARYRFYNARMAALDTLQNRAMERYKQLVYADTLIEATRVSDTARLRLRLPAEPGRYQIDYTFLLDTADHNLGLHSTHILLDTAGRQVASQPHYLGARQPTPTAVSVELRAPEGVERLEIVFGNYGRTVRGSKMEVSTPHLRVDSLTIYHFPPAEAAVDSLTRQLFPTARPERMLPRVTRDSLPARE